MASEVSGRYCASRDMGIPSQHQGHPFTNPTNRRTNRPTNRPTNQLPTRHWAVPNDLVAAFVPLMGGIDGVVTPLVPQLISMYLMCREGKFDAVPDSVPGTATETGTDAGTETEVMDVDCGGLSTDDSTECLTDEATVCLRVKSMQYPGRLLGALLLLIGTAGAGNDHAREHLSRDLPSFVQHIEALDLTQEKENTMRFSLEVIVAALTPPEGCDRHHEQEQKSAAAQQQHKQMMRKIVKVVFGCSSLLTLRCAQLSVVKVALLVPDDRGLAALFQGIALLVQEAFNPRSNNVPRAMAVLSLLGVTCKQHAAAVERRVATSTAASLGLSTDKTTQADDYLFDLTLAQTKAQSTAAQKEAAVLSEGGGFLGCFTDMLEAIATDYAAPAELRIQALATIAEYCACSSQLTAHWVPKLLSLADPTGNDGKNGTVRTKVGDSFGDHTGKNSANGGGYGDTGVETHGGGSGRLGDTGGDRKVRVAAIAVWARIGPLGQEEQRVANLVRDDDAQVRLAAVTAIFDMVLAHKVSSTHPPKSTHPLVYTRPPTKPCVTN